MTTDTVKPDTANANVYGYMILVGTGAGCYIVAGFSIVQSLVPATDIANAVGAMAIGELEPISPDLAIQFLGR